MFFKYFNPYVFAGRDRQYAEWSQAGTIGELTCGGPWISELPEEVLPPEGTESRNAIEEDMVPGIIRYDY